MKTELSDEIKKMNRLLVLMITKDIQQNEKIGLLSKAGFTPAEIAELIGASRGTVTKTISRQKK